MAFILCKLPNAAEEINGVAFKSTENGMLAEVTDEQAAHFLAIEGYEAIETTEAKPKKAAKVVAEVANEQA